VGYAVSCLRPYLIREQRLRDARPPQGWVRPASGW
jgi:hypothetical protein